MDSSKLKIYKEYEKHTTDEHRLLLEQFETMLKTEIDIIEDKLYYDYSTNLSIIIYGIFGKKIMTSTYLKIIPNSLYQIDLLHLNRFIKTFLTVINKEFNLYYKKSNKDVKIVLSENSITLKIVIHL